jgi:hypothetical protein
MFCGLLLDRWFGWPATLWISKSLLDWLCFWLYNRYYWILQHPGVCVVFHTIWSSTMWRRLYMQWRRPFELPGWLLLHWRLCISYGMWCSSFVLHWCSC